MGIRSSTRAPTADEINAGTELTPYRIASGELASRVLKICEAEINEGVLDKDDVTVILKTIVLNELRKG